MLVVNTYKTAIPSAREHVDMVCLQYIKNVFWRWSSSPIPFGVDVLVSIADDRKNEMNVLPFPSEVMIIKIF